MKHQELPSMSVNFLQSIRIYDLETGMVRMIFIYHNLSANSDKNSL